MKRRGDIVLFGMRGPASRNPVLFRLWRAFAEAGDGFAAFLAVDGPDSVDSGVSVPPGAVVERGTKAHRRLLREASFIVVRSSPADAEPSEWDGKLATPLVVVPEAGDAPSFDLAGTFADNCLFRFAARDAREELNLSVAVGLRRYQILRLDGLYSGDGVAFASAAADLAGNLRRAMERSVTFLGFSLTHIGGTPAATHGLAEGLLEAGWLVRYVCVRMSVMAGLPPGIPVVAMEDNLHRCGRRGGLLRRIIDRPLFRSHLKYDRGSCADMCGFLLKRHLRTVATRYLASTRESLHFFAEAVRNPRIEEKLYFFHTQSGLLVKNLGGAVAKLRRLDIGKAVFVTEANRIALERTAGIGGFPECCVLGNCADSSRTSERADIRWTPPAGKVSACCLVRIEESRKETFDTLLAFAAHCRDAGADDVSVSIYGKGGYLPELLARIESESLGGIVSYRGATSDPKSVYLEHDAVVDFSSVQSFGMVYIEAALNGRPVFCLRNEGSSEVLRDVPEAFYATPDELLEKLRGVRGTGLDAILRTYDRIAERFSRRAVADRFAAFIGNRGA